MVDATIVCDLGFGDAGKGTTVDWLCRTQPIHTVVRYNGGAQAAHAVVLPNGTTHKFQQFGAGTFAGAHTFLSRYVCVEPLRMTGEAQDLALYINGDPCALVAVDRDCLLTTPYHSILNRAAEIERGDQRHGSCGVGIGETMRYAYADPSAAPFVADIGTKALRAKLDALYDLARAVAPTCGEKAVEFTDDWEPEVLIEAYADWVTRVAVVGSEFLWTGGDGWVFEGSQGVLLDEWHGFHPYTTWSTCTPKNALVLCAEAGIDAEVLGVCRSYMTRHGAGPFVTEDAAVLDACPEMLNKAETWMGPFRAGYLDLVALRYAVACCEQIDGLVVTHADRALGKLCDQYRRGAHTTRQLSCSFEQDLTFQERLTEYLFGATPEYRSVLPPLVPEIISAALDVPLHAVSYGPTWEDKKASARASLTV